MYFFQVRSTSSTFATNSSNETLGRDAFKPRIRCVGMSPIVHKMANVAIAQRLERPPEIPSSME